MLFAALLRAFTTAWARRDLCRVSRVADTYLAAVRSYDPGCRSPTMFKPLRRRDQRQRLERVSVQWTSRALFPYTITTNNGTFAGFIEVRPLPEPGRVSIGYWLDQRFWGRVLITSAA